MKSRKGKSWITFNRAVKEGKESLKSWIANADTEMAADYILRMKNNSTRTRTFVDSSTKISDIYDTIRYRGLNVDIKTSSAREYPTRSKSWTFNFVELDRYDYIIFAGYDDNGGITYWLIKSAYMNLIAPPKRNAQTINNRVSFSVGISTNKGSSSWKKYEKYIISESNLKNILNRNLK